MHTYEYILALFLLTFSILLKLGSIIALCTLYKETQFFSDEERGIDDEKKTDKQVYY